MATDTVLSSDVIQAHLALHEGEFEAMVYDRAGTLLVGHVRLDIVSDGKLSTTFKGSGVAFATGEATHAMVSVLPGFPPHKVVFDHPFYATAGSQINLHFTLSLT